MSCESKTIVGCIMVLKGSESSSVSDVQEAHLLMWLIPDGSRYTTTADPRQSVFSIVCVFVTLKQFHTNKEMYMPCIFWSAA